MKVNASVKRPYRSPLREAHTQTTRLAVIEAAARLFADRGYVATSMDDIAKEAGVSRATVFTAVGGKAAVLKAAYDVAIVGDDDPVPLPQRPWARAVRDEPDPGRMVDGYAHMITEVSGRVASVYEAMRGAAATDGEVRALWEGMRSERRGGSAGFIGFLVARGALQVRLDRKRAADVVWVLNDPGLYHLLVHDRGWSPEQFQLWLANTLKSQLLGPRRSRPA
ncbi:MAG TPA: helix-turn-helix domain-containing protein [Candidatus Dormibacteraeota bacterium]